MINLKRQASREYLTAFLMCLPAVIGLLVFWFWPMYEAFRISFHNHNLISGRSILIGLGNYSRAMGDPLFWLTFRNTVLYFCLKVPLQIVLSLALALLVKSSWKGVSFVRTVALVPAVTSMVVVSVLWGLMYHPSSGLINSLLMTVGLSAQPFLSSDSQAMASIVGMMVWKEVGFSMLFFLAGLMAIPHDYYEAGRIDGANRVQLFRYITIPLLKSTTMFVLVTNMVFAFRVFVPIYLMTGGGPMNATRVVVLYVFENAFRFNRMGYASAISVILAIFLMIVSLFQLYASPKRRET